MSRVVKALDAVTTNTTGPVVALQTSDGQDEAVIQIDIQGGTVNVQIYGSITSDAPWVLMDTKTSSGIFPIYEIPYIQLATDSISGATVNAWVKN